MDKFCPSCENLFIYKENFDTKILNFICNTCDVEKPVTDFCVSTRIYNIKKEDNTNYDLLINDKTLPKQRSIVCPECNTNNISYIKQDNMHIMHLCCECKHYWLKK